MKNNSFKPASFQLILFLVILFFALEGKAQNGEHIQGPSKGNSVAMFDPSFPIFVVGENNLEMQKYAKMHPPVPLEEQFLDKDQYQFKLNEWLKLNPYYPQFIPYHLYKGGLTPEDAVRYFKQAKSAWEIAHF